jgi:hypothetical protein
MSQYQAGSEARPISGWVIGGITFAGAVMILAGSFQALTGLAAIFNDDFFVVTRNYAFDLDVTAWGWIHLLIGIFLFVAGFALFAGKVWAAVTGVLLAMISAVSNFFFIPYYPWWALLVIALDIWVIWALTRPGAVQTQGV